MASRPVGNGNISFGLVSLPVRLFPATRSKAVSLNLLLGYGGMVSLGHAAFMGLGSYVCGVLLSEGQQGLAANVFWVLAISLVLGFIVLALVWALQARDLARVHGNAYAPPQAAPAFDAQYPAAKQAGDTPDNSVRKPTARP